MSNSKCKNLKIKIHSRFGTRNIFTKTSNKSIHLFHTSVVHHFPKSKSFEKTKNSKNSVSDPKLKWQFFYIFLKPLQGTLVQNLDLRCIFQRNVGLMFKKMEIVVKNQTLVLSTTQDFVLGLKFIFCLNSPKVCFCIFGSKESYFDY
jgi:hypothetical protein